MGSNKQFLGRKETEEKSHQRTSELKLGCMYAKSLQSCLTLCNPMDCSLPGSFVHGILQARILGRVAIPFSRGSSGSPALQADSLSSEPAGKPIVTIRVPPNCVL